jgi:hypothetical protein
VITTASVFVINNRYRSEGESSIDENVLLNNGFQRREVEFRYRTIVGKANVGGTIIRPQFTTVPAAGEILHFSQPGLDGDYRVRGTHGPFIQDEALTFIIECEIA